MRTAYLSGHFTAAQLREKAAALDAPPSTPALKPGTIVHEPAVEGGPTYIVLNREDLYLTVRPSSRYTPLVRLLDGEIVTKATSGLAPIPLAFRRMESKYVGGFYRVEVPEGAKVELCYRHESGAAHYVQLRDHGVSTGIDQRGDILDVVQAQRDEAIRERNRLGYRLGPVPVGHDR